MTDECKNCTVRGDYDECLKTKCNLHDSWFAKECLKQSRELETGLQFYIRALDTICSALKINKELIIPNPNADR